MQNAKLLLPVVLSLSLAACAPTQTSRSTGRAIDDAAITARVKTEIAKSQGFGEAANVNIDTYRGVVSLAGFVDDEQQIRAAEQAAKQVPGVDRVVNNLQIKKRP